MTLDEKINEILIDSVGWDFCESEECSHYQQYLDTKEAIKQLIEEEVTTTVRNICNIGIERFKEDDAYQFDAWLEDIDTYMINSRKVE